MTGINLFVHLVRQIRVAQVRVEGGRMRGAPARAIQKPAGHQDLPTTQRYMHLSPVAIDAAIRLLETGMEVNGAAVEK